jgi:carboxyl-terminal processing protease
VSEHKNDSLLTVTPDMLSAFKSYLEKEKFDFQEDSEKRVKELRQIAERLRYGNEVLTELNTLSGILDREKARGFERYGDYIRQELHVELMAHVKNERGRIEASLKFDKQVQTAVALLKDQKQFARRMGL